MTLPYSAQIPLFTAQAVNANSAAADWAGGRGVFTAFGTFGGGTCTLQWSPDGGTTWLNVDQGTDTFCTLLANGAGGFELPPCRLRAALTGATSPVLNASISSSKN